ncbi:unnamed protein product [Effrenium voratum]|uniref:Pentatricopeptide repeat-containing protein n=1 Tax=Effrenium voratum TaxID=2562239 RepID=A0AA36MST7_9DINO|nr:unnamed protein product [Effrenium voratum]
MKARKQPLEQGTYADLISSCANVKQWQPALGLLHELETSPEVEAGPSASLYNKVISSFVREAAWQRALWLLHEMPGRQVQLDVVTYGAVASVCNRARQSLYTLQLHEEMVKKDIHPDIPSFKVAVTACRRMMKLLLQASPQKSGRQKLL